MAQERLSHAEQLNLTNRTYTMTQFEMKEAEKKYGISLLESCKPTHLPDIAPGAMVIGFMAAGITLLYTCSSLLYGLGFSEATFHLHVQEDWMHLKYDIIPSFLHGLFLFLKGVGLGIAGFGATKVVKQYMGKKETPLIKINGKRI